MDGWIIKFKLFDHLKYNNKESLIFCFQLDETFSVVLSSHSTPASRLGKRRQVNITVRKSDDPFGVIEFIRDDLDFTINESKAMELHSGKIIL